MPQERSPHANQQMGTSWPSPRIVYSGRYNIGFFGLERLHPFDSRKYGRAWRLLRQRFGSQLDRFWVQPSGPVTRDELLMVHKPEYLQQLRSARFLTGVLEVRPLKYVWWPITDWCVLRPMRWATAGTMLAARLAMDHGLAINLGGGFHHACHDDGHGFCVYADIGLAIADLRRRGMLNESDRVAYIDLDAHQGDGVCRTFYDDPRVFIYDQYNQQIFPLDILARRRIDCDVPVNKKCSEAEYLSALKTRLPAFLDSITKARPLKLAIYNAGTDIYEHDPLGRLSVSAAGVRERDRFVLEELIGRKVPTMVLLSGGYTRESYRLVAEMVRDVIQRWDRAGAPI